VPPPAAGNLERRKLGEGEAAVVTGEELEVDPVRVVMVVLGVGVHP
jgi:hypothetical protein